MAERDIPRFGELLALLRNKARLTQEELADRAQISVRAISDLERNIHPTARKATAELLADALELAGPVREEFLDAAGGNVMQAVRRWRRGFRCRRMRRRSPGGTPNSTGSVRRSLRPWAHPATWSRSTRSAGCRG
ncbi:MAG TPA: helix-turn-helix transcriptional regulator [Streptosporangiaceae bacterium]|nr:helix-turn-helix transcriptional regulator [Streptosporangiaceae bacterium]